MNRQQRTPYIRQKATTSSAQALRSMNWVVASIGGNTISVEVYGPRDGLVLTGVPPIQAVHSGVAAVSMVELVSPDPAQYSLLSITFDGPLLSSDVFILDVPSVSVMNRWGGLLSGSIQSFPVNGETPVAVDLALASWAGSEVRFSVSAEFMPVCIADGLVAQNLTNLETSSAAQWSGGELQFIFPSALSVGDEIAIAATDTLIKGQWGGTFAGLNTFLA